jgi:hypothetical protein
MSSSAIILPDKKPKVVVFDLDETLGCFGQFGLFFETLIEFYNNVTIGYTYFNELIDLYPEVFRPNIVRILDYIRKKKQRGSCSKVMIYTNNQGPAKWVQHLRGYLEKKLAEHLVGGTVQGGGSVGSRTTTLFFDRIIGGINVIYSNNDSDNIHRLTKEKTVNDFLRCSRLSSNVEICFLDDLLHQKMVDEKVYYIKLQSYYSYIPFEQIITRFINSKLYDQHYASLPCLTAGGQYMAVTNSNKQIHKQMSAIEMNNVLSKRIKLNNYDAKAVISKLNPREIDEIISKYILFHLQLFFKEDRANMNVLTQTNMTKNKTRKAASIRVKHGSPRVFVVNKETAVKAFKKEASANKRGSTRKVDKNKK